MAATLYRTLTGQSTKSAQSNQNGNRPAQLARTTTTDPFTGSLNHLTADQVQKLDQFKARLQKEGWWTPDGINGKPSHDEGTLLRYLRARKFDVDGAVGQFTDTEKWMKEQRVEDLYEHFDVEFYERARTMYPQWTGRRDKRGIPIYVFEIKGLDSKAVSKFQKESQAYKAKQPFHKKLDTPAKLLPLFALYHNLLNMVLPMCSTMERPNPEVPVTNSTNIVDISGVGLTQFWNLKQHMQEASVLATAHYPETLDRIFIIGAPSFFPTVWGWIKRWFDPVTVSKIFILSKHEVKPTLSSFMDTKNFPKKYGGELDWGWGDLPALGEEEKRVIETDGHNGWIRGPCLWLDHQRLAVGTENGKLRRPEKEIAEMKPVLYAADYTEEPVHPDKRVSSDAEDNKPANGSAVAPTEPSPHAVAAAKLANGDAPRPQTPNTPVNKNLNIHNSPAGDSQVHLPDNQPAPPAVTAEYISPNTKPQVKADDVASTEALPPATVAPAATAAAATTPSAAATATTTTDQHPTPQLAHTATPVDYVPPPGLHQPGPLPQHMVEMNKMIAHNMEGQSISTIPAVANGKLPHPEMIIASDASKGLAMEADKLNLTNEKEKPGAIARPHMERFVTAGEF